MNRTLLIAKMALASSFLFGKDLGNRRFKSLTCSSKANKCCKIYPMICCIVSISVSHGLSILLWDRLTHGFGLLSDGFLAIKNGHPQLYKVVKAAVCRYRITEVYGTIVIVACEQSFNWGSTIIMTELVLKDVPTPLYQRLKQKAIENHRSLGGEVIASLERIYGKKQIEPNALLQRARVLRSKVLGQLTDEKLSLLKNQGRL